jgi:hypothetical protein
MKSDEGNGRAGSRRSRAVAWLVLSVLMLAALLIVLTPAWLIQPFRPQTQSGLEVSYRLRQWAPLITLTVSLIALGLMLWLWKGARRWWLRAMLLVALALTLVATWFASQNHFEWMFNPLPVPAYARVAEADFLADTDMVLAIEVKGEAVAYPVRLMAYHHLVQDTVGGVPVVATY